MRMKRGEEIELQITDYAFGGKGIAKVPTEQGELAVFVPNTIPGQKVRARVVKKRKRHAECKLLDVIAVSSRETVTPYQRIPGAPYITLPIQEQEAFKTSTTLEIFRRLGHIENPEELMEGYVSSPSPFHYRNKMEYSFSEIRYDLDEEQEYDDFGLGFKHRGTWWCVENLDRDSGMFDQDVEGKICEIRTFCEKTGLPAWHPPKKKGFFRYLIVRKSLNMGKLLIDLVTTSDGIDRFDDAAFSSFVQELFGERLAGLIHSTNDDIGDRSRSSGGNGTSNLIYGDDHITEKIHGLDFRISMKSFFQTNPACAELLYQKVIDYAVEDNDLSDQVILDLFCGTGTIGQIIGKSTPSARVIGVDIVESAIADAKENAERNGITNVEFYAADVRKFLKEYPEYVGKIGTIVIDPPRAGVAPKALTRIIELGADRIVYVSCNPATQARDTATLNEAGYEMKKFTLVDQFPHTGHIESVALFIKV